jgi:cellulose synthase/poly-beta-1,6-N-acetylglucosamine synthase-like glycosyltransferase
VKLSVVIIGRNEGARLDRCLRSVRAMEQDAFDLEIIYVDSASTDDSIAIARRNLAEVVEVRPSRPTAALGRNAGWRRSTGSLILFLDGDTVLDPKFVADSLNDFDRPKTAIVWGHRREIHSDQSVFNRVLDLDWIYAPGIVEFCGGDALMRRAVLEQTGGFDETLIAGEEPEMCRRIRALGFEIVHVDLPMTGHDLAMTSPKQYWRRATRAGYAYAEVSRRFTNTAMPFWEEDARRNRNRAAMLLSIPIIGAAATLWWGVWPLAGSAAVLLSLVLRTAWKARWKSRNWGTLLLYGIHSHLQQFPIYWGQMQYERDQRAGRRRGLIEYKDAAS